MLGKAQSLHPSVLVIMERPVIILTVNLFMFGAIVETATHYSSSKDQSFQEKIKAMLSTPVNTCELKKALKMHPNQ